MSFIFLSTVMTENEPLLQKTTKSPLELHLSFKWTSPLSALTLYL